MVRLAQRLFAILLLTSPLVVGCGDSDKSSRDANTADTVTVPGDTGAKPDGVGDATVPPDTVTGSPDAGTDRIAPAPDGAPVLGDATPDKPPTTGDAGPAVITDAPADRAGDLASDGGSAAEAGTSDTGATD